jgi:hypothetical protein
MEKKLLKNIIKNFKSSKNKIYLIINNKGLIAALFAVVTIIFGTFGYFIAMQNETSLLYKILSSALKSFSLFGLNFPSYEEFNVYTIFASLFAIITVTLTAVLFFFKDQINRIIFKNISNKEHIGIFGLGQISRTFLDDEKLNQDAIIIEKDMTYAEEYRSKGFGVKIGDAFDSDFLNNTLNFETMKYALISFGNDKFNIEFAKKVIELYQSKKIKTAIKLMVHINDKNLSELFNKSFIAPNMKDIKIHIKTFSYFEECARDLFDKYPIDGDTREYIESSKILQTIVLGDGELVKRVIYKIISLSHFPNENKHVINIISKDTIKLLDDIKTYIYYGEDNGILKFPTIELNSLNLDYKRQDFYEHPIWNSENVENIIICYDDETINIQVASMLHERVFLSKTIDNEKVPKIIMGVFSELELSKAVCDNKQEYKNVYTFGNQSDVINKENLINEAIDGVAKLINNGYADEYSLSYQQINQNKVEEKWFSSARFSDKLSSISQARHIDIKLKALGLQKIKADTSKLSKAELFEQNKQTLHQALDNKRSISDEEIIIASQEIVKMYNNQEYKVNYWPQSFDTTLFDKLVRMEHNRWNTHHYLQGWRYATQKVKVKKEHDCLLPLEKFDKESIKITIIYDMYSFLYLPNYLAEINYCLIEDK